MAMAAAKGAEASAGGQVSLVSQIIVMLMLTGLAVGAGGLFGFQVLRRLDKPVVAGEQAPAPQEEKKRFGEGINLKALPPIITNLASPERTWIRLEISLVIQSDEKEANGLAATITEDIVAFLRTVTLAQIQGATGFMHLREDLNERVRVRSGGKVRDLFIHTLVVE
jgi:flagellar FliL protein